MSEEVTEKKPRVQSAARTIDILNCVARSGKLGCTAKEISETLGLPRQIVYHMLHTLSDVGALRRGRGTSYVLGLAIAPIAQGFRNQLDTGDKWDQFARAVAERTGESSYVVGWINDQIVVLASVRGTSEVAAAEISLGTTGDPHARASGKLLLSALPQHDAQRYLESYERKKRTPNTLSTLDELFREFEVIRREGVANDREEYAMGLTCAATFIRDSSTGLALCISAPTERFHANGEAYIAQIRDIAASNFHN